VTSPRSTASLTGHEVLPVSSLIPVLDRLAWARPDLALAIEAAVDTLPRCVTCTIPATVTVAANHTHMGDRGWLCPSCRLDLPSCVVCSCATTTYYTEATWEAQGLSVDRFAALGGIVCASCVLATGAVTLQECTVRDPGPVRRPRCG
jgi:hypothetical protein